MKEIFWSWIDTIAERDVAVALAPIFRVNKGRTKGRAERGTNGAKVSQRRKTFYGAVFLPPQSGALAFLPFFEFGLESEGGGRLMVAAVRSTAETTT